MAHSLLFGAEEFQGSSQHVQTDGTSGALSTVDRFEALLKEDRNHLALAHSDGTECTRQELWDIAGEVAAKIRAVIPDPRVITLCMPNVASWVPIYLGILRAGATPATLPSSTDPAVLADSLHQVGADGLATLDYNFAADVKKTGHARRTEYVVVEHEKLKQPVDFRLTVLEYDDAPELPDFCHQIMFTSGTTGRPRAAMHSEETMAAFNKGVAEAFNLGPDTPIFMGSPLGHATGVVHGVRLAAYTGAPLIVLEKWNVAEGMVLAEHYNAAFTIAATPFLADAVQWIDEHPGHFETSLRYFLCGGAPVPPALIRRAHELVPQLFVSPEWAMTEGGLTTCVPGDHIDKINHTVGSAYCEAELAIFDADNKQVPVGVEGQLGMRGPAVFLGYLGDEEHYRESLTEDGYFLTGDLGILDEDGFLSITGRAKDIIIRGGVNIAPLPLETALFEHPEVKEVSVIGKPDDRLGERLCACVVTTGRGDLSLQELIDWLHRRGVNKRMWPEHLELLSEFPRTAAGKVEKVKLKRQVFGEAV